MKDSTIMRNSIKKALEIAQEVHRFQLDLARKPYINHPIVVSKMVRGKKAKIVALLHDVLEDGSYTKNDLKKFFSKDVCDAVEAITKTENNYFKYILRVKENNLARKVKLADLKHNMDVTRLKSLDEKEISRLKKYLCAYHMLEYK